MSRGPLIQARVSDDAREGWREFSARHGVSVSAVIESLGHLVAEDFHPAGTLGVDQLVTAARAVDHGRKARTP